MTGDLLEKMASAMCNAQRQRNGLHDQDGPCANCVDDAREQIGLVVEWLDQKLWSAEVGSPEWSHPAAARSLIRQLDAIAKGGPHG